MTSMRTHFAAVSLVVNYALKNTTDSHAREPLESGKLNFRHFRLAVLDYLSYIFSITAAFSSLIVKTVFRSKRNISKQFSAAHGRKLC